MKAVATNTTTQRIAPVAVIALCTVFGLSLSIQGWRSRITTFDLVTAIESAQEFVATGRVPDRGILTSFASYTPPGTAWLMLPGVLTFKDPRLFELVGSGILYLGTLVGIFLLARNHFGMPCAYLSVALYGLSELGLFYSNSLWPRGHPFFWRLDGLLGWAMGGTTEREVPGGSHRHLGCRHVCFYGNRARFIYSSSYLVSLPSSSEPSANGFCGSREYSFVVPISEI
jgi:hypothetical protein